MHSISRTNQHGRRTRIRDPFACRTNRGPALTLAAKHHLFRKSAGVLFFVLSCAMAVGSCTGTAIYQPVNYEEIHGRPAVFLEPVYLPPTDRELHSRIVSEAQAELKEFPYFGSLLSYEEAREKALEDPLLQRAMELTAETLSVVGITERGAAARVGNGLGIELLVTVQIIFTPCDLCPEGSQLALIANLVEASTARPLWRGHFVENLTDYDEEILAEEADSMLAEFFEIFEEDLRPKWHRLRFAALARGKST